MRPSNKSAGTMLEISLAERLHALGFWAHRLTQSEEGQPADIIACRSGAAWLIDCKLCSGGEFRLARIEENQELAMNEFRKRGNREGLFALQLDDGSVYMLSIGFVLSLRDQGFRSLTSKDIRLAGLPFDDWAAKCP